uniref:Uncharacterized protein n=1 Tax=Palpitomonas bilix TaxID=652834 RepID=A0A7S3G2F0_9EUKA|mmetsp:Transcript_23293/g.59023  ORF Transcript_23293/g.59023 Transcript_23293/m.59023 type:complete len:128 (+) Transcript_23293:179-562(+)|eukprot:CAMPEP_0113883718 /NCGR_PEP_ID=MMETSP0780_2-20120614/9778_1 /TAXON_ID=652834 /ORGANISM="Palpitomonas bilix" /LENGTH=127 /DNA_ID=CAMNT_0000871099 /DNA_START=138 /DNA_END=521 /DNA_ORIENTATION=- /assembly_acc=CAM_ASM_000599
MSKKDLVKKDEQREAAEKELKEKVEQLETLKAKSSRYAAFASNIVFFVLAFVIFTNYEDLLKFFLNEERYPGYSKYAALFCAYGCVAVLGFLIARAVRKASDKATPELQTLPKEIEDLQKKLSSKSD